MRNHLPVNPLTPSPIHLEPPAGIADSCRTLIRLATLGGLVRGSAAAASNLRQVQAGALDTTSALEATARCAVVGAAATAVAGAVAGAVADQGLLRLGLMFAVGTGVVYGLDRWARGRGQDDA